MIPIIDLFAGPGGLNEGFSTVEDDSGNAVFNSVGSFEMDPTAVETLKLRAAFRSLRRKGVVPESYYAFIRGEMDWKKFKSDPAIATAFEEADGHVFQVELGGDGDKSDNLIRAALKGAGVSASSAWALIGGPPCQAYSLAGRSRRAKDETFATDKKHFLYREYLRIIRTFKPSVFVMENVKGLLSSTTSGANMFDLIKADLERPETGLEYDVHSLTIDSDPGDLRPRDFIIRAEKFGVPQKRHRVILLGIKKGFLKPGATFARLVESDPVPVRDAIAGLPKLRSGVSPVALDSLDRWLTVRGGEVTEDDRALTRGAAALIREGQPTNEQFRSWVIDPKLSHVTHHETRRHMTQDLKRYRFAALKAETALRSPLLSEFPPELQPNHKNATAASRPFSDRFRVQLSGEPATTIVSHISKDGHYYIHPDPAQMRSITVREAARLQTFPDNYFFRGTRTEQYHQVGNAVPPLLAFQIATVVSEIFSVATT